MKMAPVAPDWTFLLAAATVGLLVLGGLVVLVVLLANEKTRLVGIVLLVLSVPGALVAGGGLFLLLRADPAQLPLPATPSVEFDPTVIHELPLPAVAGEHAETVPPEPADTAAEAVPAAEPETETNADASNATSEDASDGANS